jgi:radical SAM superfamily enzyme YgiQ (UPF0313 family)
MKTLTGKSNSLTSEQEKCTEADRTLTQLFPKRRIERILFILPPNGDESIFAYDIAKRGRYENYPPYGFGTLATFLRNDGIEIRVTNLSNTVLDVARKSENEKDFDFLSIIENELKQALDDFDPDFIGVTCMFSQTHVSAKNVCNLIKQIAPDVPLALGGVHPTNSYEGKDTREMLLKDFKVDFLFLFEGELSFRDFVQVVNKQLPTSELAQVIFTGRSNHIHFTQLKKPNSEDLNVIPAFDLMDLENINKNGKIGKFYYLLEPEAQFATVMSNRGCRGRCTFCSVRSFNGKGVRGRSVQIIIDEILLLRDTYNVSHIMWLDDDLFYNQKHTIKLFNEMVRQNVGVTWDASNGVMAASCTEELMYAAAESGCNAINIGMESGNPKILKDIKKPGTVKQFLKAAEVLRKIESIFSHVFIMIGFPGETYQMMMDTIEVALEMKLDWYNVNTLMPLPNTSIFEKMKEEKLIKKVGFESMRFSGGSYGKVKTNEKRRDLLAKDFKNTFASFDLDTIPNPLDLDKIWAYMNFHMNFVRLFNENRSMKLRQQIKNLENICTLVSPDNAIAQYFYGYLFFRLNNYIEPKITKRLEDTLEKHPYWQKHFSDFNLSPEHLLTANFPGMQ